MSEQKKTEKNRKGGKIVFAGCAVIIVSSRQGQKEEEPVNRNVVINKDNVEEVLSQLDEQESVPVGYYEAVMNSTWHFASGDEASDNAYVENAETNTNAVYFDVIRSDTEETIYESPIIPVGSYLENIALDTALPAGTYDCILTYHLLDEENVSISTLKLTVTIVIDQ